VAISTWGDLLKYHCASKWLTDGLLPHHVRNPCYETISTRRYNYSTSSDVLSCRLVFLNGVLDKPENKTLVRNGRFIWCRHLKYEGVDESTGLRNISFRVDKGKKRFYVSENEVLCLPSKTFINNNHFFRHKETIFRAFSTVFGYKNTLNMMFKNSDLGLTRDEFLEKIKKDGPYRPGTLVAPRKGYFYPTSVAMDQSWSRKYPEDLSAEHPYGIIIGSSPDNSDYSGREFYRVRFGGTTYERIHPIEMEIINEV